MLTWAVAVDCWWRFVCVLVVVVVWWKFQPVERTIRKPAKYTQARFKINFHTTFPREFFSPKFFFQRINCPGWLRERWRTNELWTDKHFFHTSVEDNKVELWLLLSLVYFHVKKKLGNILVQKKLHIVQVFFALLLKRNFLINNKFINVNEVSWISKRINLNSNRSPSTHNHNQNADPDFYIIALNKNLNLKYQLAYLLYIVYNF